MNVADRPVQVGSHFHFASVNTGLEFDRDAAHGYRLDIPAGTLAAAVGRAPSAEAPVSAISDGPPALEARDVSVGYGENVNVPVAATTSRPTRAVLSMTR